MTRASRVATVRSGPTERTSRCDASRAPSPHPDGTSRFLAAALSMNDGPYRFRPSRDPTTSCPTSGNWNGFLNANRKRLSEW